MNNFYIKRIENIIGAQYLLSTKQQKKFTICVVCGAIVNAILNVLMIPKLQSLGAVIATVAAEFSVTAMELYFVKEEFNIKEIFSLSKLLTNGHFCAIIPYRL